MKVGIIGMGIVGNAVAESARGCTLSTFDKYNESKTQNWGAFDKTELCFVCVPTPTKQGLQDIQELLATMILLQKMKYKGVVCVKSTVIPGTMRMMQINFTDLRLVHNPEFLSEKTAVKDFWDQDVALLSGKIENTSIVAKFFDKFLKINETMFSEVFEVTEYAKYIHNCILAVKLSFLNEVFELMNDKNNYDRATEMAARFGNVGSHHRVPGPDGKRGWGGMCFPKDTKALLSYSIGKKVPMLTLNGAVATNIKLRPEEMIEGHNAK